MINSQEEADTSSLLLETGGSRVLRQGSKKLWKRIGRGDSNCGSRADLEAETAMDQHDRISSSYNNLLNNQQPGYVILILMGSIRCFIFLEDYSSCKDRLMCNGGSAHEGSFNRKPVLSHQNSFGSPTTLSPQNSIRSNGSSPRTPSPFNLTVGYNVFRSCWMPLYLYLCFILSFQSNNFPFTTELPGSNTAIKAEEPEEKKKLIVRLYERYPRLKEREDYSLFIFSPTNA